MRKTNIWFLNLLFFTGIGLGSCNQADKDSKYITVNVNENYPEKEIVLQDFMDVEYIPLETTDEFITQGAVLSIGDKYILIKNYVNDGNIYVFDRKTGKGIRKINRKGQGGEEYAFIVSAALDEDNEEIFVNSTKKILVYDLSGNFKRSFNTADDADYMDVFNYDKNNLICYDMTVYYRDGEEKEKEFYHSIISKQDGSVTRDISIPFKTVKAPFVRQGDVIAAIPVRALIPCQDNCTLIDFWASWCGPCKREMPTVVEAYDKYKNKGFGVVGVSLDNNADSWKQAIKDLNITWPQMSDLKGWQCEGASLYGVRAIPVRSLFSVLLPQSPSA